MKTQIIVQAAAVMVIGAGPVVVQKMQLLGQ